jgi:hypothetical protein
MGAAGMQVNSRQLPGGGELSLLTGFSRGA